MKRRFLVGYQILTGLSDASTGALLILNPALTLRLMGLQGPPNTLPFLSFIGAFVLSIGIACFYGAVLATRLASAPKLEVIWVLTAITRGLVALVIVTKILSGSLETRWAVVAISDGLLALLQGIGLKQGWLSDAA